jgi:hypothetical protein
MEVARAQVVCTIGFLGRVPIDSGPDGRRRAGGKPSPGPMVSAGQVAEKSCMVLLHTVP